MRCDCRAASSVPTGALHHSAHATHASHVNGKGNYGYNAATGEYGDMIEAGILDPTKVTRFALQNATSVAGLLLTTEAMIADAPQDDAGSPGMPDMGGMGGMGGMM